jgi:hypothetical protein
MINLKRWLDLLGGQISSFLSKILILNILKRFEVEWRRMNQEQRHPDPNSSSEAFVASINTYRKCICLGQAQM